MRRIQQSLLTTWEYKIVTDWNTGVADLNRLGADGWELVQYDPEFAAAARARVSGTSSDAQNRPHFIRMGASQSLDTRAASLKHWPTRYGRWY
jgi:hypothetical protein